MLEERLARRELDRRFQRYDLVKAAFPERKLGRRHLQEFHALTGASQPCFPLSLANLHRGDVDSYDLGHVRRVQPPEVLVAVAETRVEDVVAGRQPGRLTE